METRTVYSEERVPLRSAKTVIDSLAAPLAEAARIQLKELIDHESHSLMAAYREREYTTLHDARSDRDQALARRDQAAADLAVAQAEARRIEEEPAPGWTKTIIAAFCALACFAAEFTLTWQALTFVLNVPKYSVLGVLLGLAPPSALAVLEIVVLRMIEGPWRQRLRAAGSMSPWRRVAAAATMLAFLLALGWGNLHTVLLLAEAREEAAKAQYNLMREDGDELVAVNQQVINRAILAVSLCVTVDGALFLLLALEEGRALRDRGRALRRLALMRKRHDDAAAALAEAGSKLATVEKSHEALEANAQILAERFRRQCLFDLEQRCQKFRCEMTAEQLVEFGLRGKAA
jgi:hypothetical protein